MDIGPADDSGRLKDSGRPTDSGRLLVTVPELSWSGQLMAIGPVTNSGRQMAIGPADVSGRQMVIGPDVSGIIKDGNKKEGCINVTSWCIRIM